MIENLSNPITHKEHIMGIFTDLDLCNYLKSRYIKIYKQETKYILLHKKQAFIFKQNTFKTF